jgi:hypothetical protein
MSLDVSSAAFFFCVYSYTSQSFCQIREKEEQIANPHVAVIVIWSLYAL